MITTTAIKFATVGYRTAMSDNPGQQLSMISVFRRILRFRMHSRPPLLVPRSSVHLGTDPYLSIQGPCTPHMGCPDNLRRLVSPMSNNPRMYAISTFNLPFHPGCGVLLLLQHCLMWLPRLHPTNLGNLNRISFFTFSASHTLH